MVNRVLPSIQGKNPYAPQIGVHRPPYYWEYKSHAYGIDYKPQKRKNKKKKAEKISEEPQKYEFVPFEQKLEVMDQ